MMCHFKQHVQTMTWVKADTSLLSGGALQGLEWGLGWGGGGAWCSSFVFLDLVWLHDLGMCSPGRQLSGHTRKILRRTAAREV